MKRSTAMVRLEEVMAGLGRDSIWGGPAVQRLYVTGMLLTDTNVVDRIELVLQVDEPAAAVPWLAAPRHLEALAGILRLAESPIDWFWRPAEWPPWNHRITSAAPVWTTGTGGEVTQLAAMSDARVGELTIDAPANSAALRAQLEIERAVARAHLAEVVANYHDRDWRREHRGGGHYPDGHLWRASAAFIELDDALTQHVT